MSCRLQESTVEKTVELVGCNINLFNNYASLITSTSGVLIASILTLTSLIFLTVIYDLRTKGDAVKKHF